jgi:hypothetical protein
VQFPIYVRKQQAVMEFSILPHEQRTRLCFQLVQIIASKLSVIKKMFEYMQKYRQSFHFMTLRKPGVKAALVHNAHTTNTSLTEMINTYALTNCSRTSVSEDILRERPLCHVLISYVFHKQHFIDTVNFKRCSDTNYEL